MWKQENISNKPFKANVNKVPVFVRGQTCTPVSSTLNGFNSENKNSEAHESSESEDYDFEVVDWKNKSVVKITNISDLKILDLLQFKVSMIFNIICIFDRLLKYFIIYHICRLCV